MSEICHEQGVVTRVGPGRIAHVTIERGEACGACAARGACQVLGSSRKEFVVPVENTLGAQEGDVVRLSMEESAVLEASAIVYLIPAVGMIAGVAAGWLLASGEGSRADGPAAVGCFAGLIIGLVVSWAVGKRAVARKAIVLRLTAITGRRGAAFDP